MEKSFDGPIYYQEDIKKHLIWDLRLQSQSLKAHPNSHPQNST